LGDRLPDLDSRQASLQARWTTATGALEAQAAARQEALEKELREHLHIRILSGLAARMLCVETFRTRCGRKSGAMTPSSFLLGIRAPSLCGRNIPESWKSVHAPETTWWRSLDNSNRHNTTPVAPARHQTPLDSRYYYVTQDRATALVTHFFLWQEELCCAAHQIIIQKGLKL